MSALGQPSAAKTAHDAIKYSVDVWEVNLVCARVLQKHGHFEEAEDAILRNLDVNLERPQSLAHLVWVYYRSGNVTKLAEQLADIAISSAQTAVMFGIVPRVALISYSTGQSGKGEDVEKVRRATDIAKKLRPDLKLEGPIQYDAAVDAAVAQTKLPGSDVAGHATVFIFPDLNTGNTTYKAVQRSANAVAVGPVLQGRNKPVNDLSRGCTIPDIVNTVAITAIQAQENSRGSAND